MEVGTGVEVDIGVVIADGVAVGGQFSPWHCARVLAGITKCTLSRNDKTMIILV